MSSKDVVGLKLCAPTIKLLVKSSGKLFPAILTVPLAGYTDFTDQFHLQALAEHVNKLGIAVVCTGGLFEGRHSDI